MQHANAVHVTCQVVIRHVANKDHEPRLRRLDNREDVRDTSEYFIRVRSTVIAARLICRMTENNVCERAPQLAPGIFKHLFEEPAAGSDERLSQGVLDLPWPLPDEQDVAGQWPSPQHDMPPRLV